MFGAAIKEARFRWKEKKVPFKVAEGLPNAQRVTDAIAHWHAKTPLRFVERTIEEDFVTFRPEALSLSSAARAKSSS